MNTPRVSVILSSLNHGQFLGEAIQSVLSQTFTDFELFIIDDCSEDSSWEIIQSFNDPRITAIRNPVRSRGAYGFNETIRHRAKGEFVAIHHSDDLWLPEKLEKQVVFLDGHSDVGAVFTKVILIDEQGDRFLSPHYYQSAFHQSNRNRFEWLRFFFMEGNCLCHPSVMARRKVMLNVGLYDRRLGQITDFDLWVRICLHYEIYILEEELTKFRIREGNANQSGENSSMYIRSRNEWVILLERMFLINNEKDFFLIFPEMEYMQHSTGNNLPFLIAIYTTKLKEIFKRQFGLNMIYGLMGNDATASEIRDKYGFGYIELINLAAQIDPFHSNELSEMINHLRQLENATQQLEQQLENEIVRIKGSTSWRITAPLRVMENIYRGVLGKASKKVLVPRGHSHDN